MDRSDRSRDYTTQLYRVASPLFLFLTSFRRKVQKGYPVSISSVEGDLDDLFQKMGQKVKNEPRLDSLYDKAKYPLVVLADEVLIHSGWDHADEWQRDHLLEKRYFKTNIGGDKFFNLASELRHEEVELATIYFTAISLGFRGNLRGQPEKVTEVRTKLYRQMADYLADSKRELTPDAYHVTPKEARRLSPAVTLARVAFVGVGLLAFYWLTAWLLWTSSVSDLRSLVLRLAQGGTP